MEKILNMGNELVTEHTKVPIEKQIMIFTENLARLNHNLKIAFEQFEKLEVIIKKTDVTALVNEKNEELQDKLQSQINSVESKVSKIIRILKENGKVV